MPIVTAETLGNSNLMGADHGATVVPVGDAFKTTARLNLRTEAARPLP